NLEQGLEALIRLIEGDFTGAKA
ncbi:TPA: TetR/AcrR family transcriptional regulator, partial [Vibrio cholerae]|nr:TetR/AcrR family transcriptional regulator [Vibrio cholerae]